MSKSIIYFFITFTLFSNIVLATPYIAKVVRVRGKATQLEPGAEVARKIKVGDKLRVDTSILTGNKSFVRVLFLDNSVLNVGPRSKVSVVETKEDGTSFIHLLKGTIRSKIHKNKASSKHKFYVKTRSAAMGVRGTEFQVVYNPANNISSLVAYKGEVAMAKVEEDPAAEVKRLKKIRRKQLAQRSVETTASGEVEYIESKGNYDLEGRMDQALTNKETVNVKQGQYSGTVNSIKRASIPVKISPVQLNALYDNDEMKEKVRRSEVKAKSLSLENQNFAIKAEAQEPPPEGFYEPKTGKFAPRSGGVLDINSGLYIPPEKDSVFNGKSKVFVPTDSSGRIDSETGQYVTPKGVKLDSVKGFIARGSKNKDQQVLLAQVDNLNRATKVKFWAGDDLSKVEAPTFKHWSETEKLSKDIIEIETFGYTESFESTNETGGTSRSLKSESAKRLLIRWSHNSESKWQPITSFGFKATEYSTTERGTLGQPTRDGVMLGIGVRYNLSSRWNFLSELFMEQELYMNSENSNLYLKRVSVPKLKLGFEGALFKTGRFSFDTHLYLVMAMPKESGSHELGMGLGYGLDLLPRWWLNRKWTLYTGFSLQNQSQSVSNTGFKADNSHAKAGVKLGVGYQF